MIEFKKLKMDFGENWFEAKMKAHQLTKAEIIFGIVGIMYILGLPLFVQLLVLLAAVIFMPYYFHYVLFSLFM